MFNKKQVISIQLGFNDFNNEFQVAFDLANFIGPVKVQKKTEHWNGRLTSVRVLLFFSLVSHGHNDTTGVFQLFGCSWSQANLVSSFQRDPKGTYKCSQNAMSKYNLDVVDSGW